jgi:hypothetical protein
MSLRRIAVVVDAEVGEVRVVQVVLEARRPQVVAADAAAIPVFVLPKSRHSS